MNEHSPCSPLLLSAPTRRPATLGPPKYSGSTHTLHTAHNHPPSHDTSYVFAPTFCQYTSRREYMAKVPQSASQHSSLDTYHLPSLLHHPLHL